MPHASMRSSASSASIDGRGNSASSMVFGFLSTAARTMPAIETSLRASREKPAGAMRRVQLRGGARRQPARRTLCTLSRLSRAPTKQMGRCHRSSALFPPALGHVLLPWHPAEQAPAVDVDGEAAQGIGGLGAEEYGDPAVVVGGEESPFG